MARRGEELAAQAYRHRGYRVVARNWRAGRHGELDLVVTRDRVLVICEVKTRSSTRFGLPAEAVDGRKRRQVRRLAVHFVAARGLGPAALRFDVASVRGDRVELIEDAF